MLPLTFTALGRALAERYDAVHSHEEGGLIGVVLAAALRVPHLYDMHSSLPQQLTNFAFSGSPLVRRRLPRNRAADDSALARRDRHLSVARGHRARHRSGRRRSILIENAPGSAEGEATPAQAAAVRAASGSARRRRSCCTPGRSRPIRGSICCLPRWRSSAAAVPTRGCCWPAASRIR